MSDSGKKMTEIVNAGKDIPKVTPDIYFKQCMTNLNLARDFLTFNLPEKIKRSINLDSLALAPHEYITAAQRRKVADIVYTVGLYNTEDEVGFLMLHVEHQTRPQRLMPLRMLEFMTTMMRQYAEKQGNTDSAPIPVVVPIIVSNHHGTYPFSTRFLDLFTEVGQTLVSSLMNGELPLVDLASMPDDALKNHLTASIMESALKHVKKCGLREIFELCLGLLGAQIESGELSVQSASEHAQNLLYFLCDNVKEVPSADEVDDIMATYEHMLPSGTGEIIVTLREHFIERGVQQGLERGVKQGLERGVQQGLERGVKQGLERGVKQGLEQGTANTLRKVVFSMLKNGLSDEQIMICTEMSHSDLVLLKVELMPEVDPQH